MAEAMNLEAKLGRSLDELIKEQKTKQAKKPNMGKKPVKAGAAGAKQNAKTPAKKLNPPQQKQKTLGSNKGVAAMKPTQRGGVTKQQGATRGRTVAVQRVRVQDNRGHNVNYNNNNQRNNNNQGGNQGRGNRNQITRAITVNARGGIGKPAFKRREHKPDLLNASRQPLGDRFEKMRQPQQGFVNTAPAHQGGPKRNAHGLIMPF